jgi:hypothetical protein
LRHSTAFPHPPALLLGLMSCTLLPAGTITVPAGLTAGDQYRLIFITADAYTATSTDINHYNGVVTAEANSVSDLAALDTSWYAVGSTATVNAIDNVGIDSGVAIYDLNGNEIASDAGTTGNGMFNSSGYLLTGLNTNENDGLIPVMWMFGQARTSAACRALTPRWVPRARRPAPRAQTVAFGSPTRRRLRPPRTDSTRYPGC